MFAANYTFGDPPRRVVQPTREEAIRRAEQILRAAGVEADIVPRHPKRQPGSVLIVFSGPHRTPKTRRVRERDVRQVAR
ncbi:hypothetical protein [Micromonospora sp. WMMC250]|uniref:hypothetical protein n=1 Tax=Micromonospora sp. WMMC250 TaxID=3014781 RepID=UPI0022B69E87|nr:hypothetical protein [Micromonospora sp. WMMC250]MCZ7373374.1 hypothetical protein [Micromonospora sp. WMMC250]